MKSSTRIGWVAGCSSFVALIAALPPLFWAPKDVVNFPLSGSIDWSRTTPFELAILITAMIASCVVVAFLVQPRDEDASGRLTRALRLIPGVIVAVLMFGSMGRFLGNILGGSSLSKLIASVIVTHLLLIPALMGVVVVTVGTEAVQRSRTLVSLLIPTLVGVGLSVAGAMLIHSASVANALHSTLGHSSMNPWLLLAPLAVADAVMMAALLGAGAGSLYAVPEAAATATMAFDLGVPELDLSRTVYQLDEKPKVRGNDFHTLIDDFGREWGLNFGETAVGRDETNRLSLGLEGTVSRRHARIVVEYAGYMWIEDLGSLNGTRVNGMPISGPTALHHGDVVQLGRAKLSVRRARHTVSA